MRSKLLLFILLLAFVLRFYKLGQIPPSLDWDETSNAYNAFSILKTGRDEYGDFLPLTNRSFDDYKPPLYMYFDVPSVAIFGLTPFAARLPSALFGFLTVPLIYLLTKKLFENSDWKLDIPLVATALLAISPWHLQFSRVGFEANLGLFFTVATFTCFLYGLTNRKWLIAASLLAAISLYTYHSQRIFVPALLFFSLLIWRSQIFALPKKFLLFVIAIFTLTVLPLIVLTPQKVILKRLETTAADTRLADINRSISYIESDRLAGLPAANLIHNRRLVIAQSTLKNYLLNFDLNFLFTKGDGNFRHHIADRGMLYLFELLLVLLGIYLLIKDHSKQSLFILTWLLVAPLAAAPAHPSPHAVRSLPMVISLEIVGALAIVFALSRKFSLKKPLIALYFFWILVSFIVYLHNYWQHYSLDKAEFWQYGYRQAVGESEKLKGQFDQIIVDKSIEQAYIFWLFNTKYDPKLFQKSSKNHFDKYYFDAKPPTEGNQLFVSDPGHFPSDFRVVKTVYYPNGKEAVIIGHPNK